MLLNILQVLTIDLLISAGFLFFFNYPIKSVAVHHLEYALLFLMLGTSSGLMLQCFNLFPLNPTKIFFIFLSSIALIIMIILMFIETSWKPVEDNLIEMGFNTDDYTSNFKDKYKNILSVNECFVMSKTSLARVNFFIRKPPAGCSFTAYCYKSNDKFSSDKDYRCIAYTYSPKLFVAMESIIMYIFCMGLPILYVTEYKGLIFSYAALFVIMALFRKLLWRSKRILKVTLLCFFFVICELVSILGILQSFISLAI